MTTPILNVSVYQNRTYEPPSCWKLVTDVYSEVLGAEPHEVETVSESMRRAARAFRINLFKNQPGMRQLLDPQDLAVALMWPANRQWRAHCGIVWEGKILHATEAGVLYQDMASLRSIYPQMEFWGRA